MIKPTLLGFVGTVNGESVGVRFSENISSGIAIIGGKSYRIGQVGSFVRIPQGYHDLYGIVAEVGAQSVDKTKNRDFADERWMTVQLVGEVIAASFERGISQYPNVHDEVHLVTEEDLSLIYGSTGNSMIKIGRLSSAETISVQIDINKLVTRHSAVVGSTGSGKSTTVSSLLRSISSASDDRGKRFPNARILLIDVHGEYGKALASEAKVFQITPAPGEHDLKIPFWALEPLELIAFLMGKIDDKQSSQILDRIYDYRSENGSSHPLPGVALNSMTSSTPLPFSLKRLWFELINIETKTWTTTSRDGTCQQL